MINKLTRISLTGMMGSGKTSIGKILAKKISLPFYDSDNDIEDKLNIKISEIFEKYGESWFRKQEEKICKDILKKEKFVLALGGGAITNKLIRDNIAKNSLLIYLKTDENILFERLKNDKSRPLLKETNLKKQGMLGITFSNESDYDLIQEDDLFNFIDLESFSPGKQLTIEIIHSDGSKDVIKADHTYNQQQIEWYKEGSALNLIKKSN